MKFHIPQKLIDDKYISVQRHPYLPLSIYNYSNKTQFESYWNKYTLQCRGLVLDEQDNIVSHCLKKFFNLDQVPDQIPDEPFQVYEKLDGSYISLSHYQGDMVIASRGSFTSDQAVWAKEIIRTKYQKFIFLPQLNYTYIFELIHPENRIVVDYKGRKDLILLTVFDNKTGEEVDMAQFSILPQAKRYDGVTDFRLLEKEQKENEEGFVVRFKSGYRIKMKFEEYKRLHKLLTGVNARTVWEAVRSGESIESMCYRVPDEFYQWIQKAAQRLKEEYRFIETRALELFADIEKENLPTRKEKAAIYAQYPDYRPLLFMILDGKDYRETIWKMIKPAAEKPFKQDEP